MVLPVRIDTSRGARYVDILSGRVYAASPDATNEGGTTQTNARLWHEYNARRQKKYSAIVVCGYDCNLNCSYCFQKNGCGGSGRIPSELPDWMAARLKRGIEPATKANIAFTGGETSLYLAFVEWIMATTHDPTKVQYALLTNGIISGPALARLKSLKRYGLSKVQVTFHRSIMDSQEGAFFRTLRELRENFDTVLRFNVSSDHADIEAFKAVIAKVKAAGCAGMSIASRRIYKCGAEPRSEIRKSYANLQEVCLHAMRSGFRVPLMSVFEQCNIGSRTTEILLPTARAVPCLMMSSPDADYVDRACASYAAANGQPMQFTDFPSKCQKCSYFALCMGGCRMGSYIAGRGFSLGVCHKEYLAGVFGAIVAHNIERNEPVAA